MLKLDEIEAKPIDCWDECNCDYCKDHRKEWLEDEYNKRAMKWLKENEAD